RSGPGRPVPDRSARLLPSLRTGPVRPARWRRPGATGAQAGRACRYEEITGPATPAAASVIRLLPAAPLLAHSRSGTGTATLYMQEDRLDRESPPRPPNFGGRRALHAR